jgi:hypothetical protein
MATRKAESMVSEQLMAEVYERKNCEQALAESRGTKAVLESMG